jgi:hypothetical protein
MKTKQVSTRPTSQVALARYRAQDKSKALKKSGLAGRTVIPSEIQ